MTSSLLYFVSRYSGHTAGQPRRASTPRPVFSTLIGWIIGFCLWAAIGPSAHAYLESDTGTFINPGVFVTIEQPFTPLTITPEMIQAGETDPIEAVLRVHSTTPYTLRVYIASDNDVDLAGSTVNASHPMLVGGIRDVFFYQVSDHTGEFQAGWKPGSTPETRTNQSPSYGTEGNVHYVRLKLIFTRNGQPYFLDARPGTYHVTLTYEVETES